MSIKYKITYSLKEIDSYNKDKIHTIVKFKGSSNLSGVEEIGAVRFIKRSTGFTEFSNLGLYKK